jgi:hypothetical protein
MNKVNHMNCVHCQQPIAQGRLKALPNTKTCVECSTAGMKRGLTVTLGEGDHTCNELVIMEEKEYFQYKQAEAKVYGTLPPVMEDVYSPNELFAEVSQNRATKEIDYKTMDNSNLSE